MTKRSEKVPKSVEPIYHPIIALIDDVCEQHLSDEYALLSRQLAAALARKRPPPIQRGKPEIWACAIVYAIGTVNFLFDKSQAPYMSSDELCAAFGVKKSTASNKAKTIRGMFDMYQMDPDWSLPSRLDDNPLVWMIEVNGFIVDVRHAPRETQEVAFERGIIPYIPSDRNPGAES